MKKVKSPLQLGDAAGADVDGLRLLVHLVPRVGAALDRMGDVIRGLVLHLEAELSRLEDRRTEVWRGIAKCREALSLLHLGATRGFLLPRPLYRRGLRPRLVRGGLGLLDAPDEKTVRKLVAAQHPAIFHRLAVLEDDVREFPRRRVKDVLRRPRRKDDASVLGDSAAGKVADQSA